MRFYIAPKICYSHLCPTGGRYLAARNAKAMREWVEFQHAKQRNVTHVTLTYSPEEYGHPDDPDIGEAIYKDQQANKHLSRFWKRFEDHTGYSVKGKWRAKLEFNKRGHPHFHILAQIPYLPKKEFDQLWGHGHTWVTRADKEAADYVSKYQSKAQPYPEFLYDRPRRSVKIWHTSPGFFDEVHQDELDAEIGIVSSLLGDEFWAEAKRVRKEQRQSLATMIGLQPKEWKARSIREQIELSRERTIIRDDQGEAVEIEGVQAPTLILVLSQLKAEFQGSKYGWFRFETHWNEIEVALRIASRNVDDLINAKRRAEDDDFWIREAATHAAQAAGGGDSFTLFKYQVREDTDIDELPFEPFDPQYGQVVYDDEIPI